MFEAAGGLTGLPVDLVHETRWHRATAAWEQLQGQQEQRGVGGERPTGASTATGAPQACSQPPSLLSLGAFQLPQIGLKQAARFLPAASQDVGTVPPTTGSLLTLGLI